MTRLNWMVCVCAAVLFVACGDDDKGGGATDTNGGGTDTSAGVDTSKWLFAHRRKLRQKHQAGEEGPAPGEWRKEVDWQPAFRWLRALEVRRPRGVEFAGARCR